MTEQRGSRPAIVLVIAIVFGIYLLAGFFASPDPQPSPPGRSDRCVIPEAPLRGVAVEHWYKGQVIVTGPAGMIGRVVQQVEDRLGLQLEATMICSLANPASLPDSDPVAQEPESAAAQGAIEFFFFIFDPRDAEVEEVVAALNAAGAESGVWADPNYLLGHLANSPCSDPFGMEGSPFGMEGSPFGMEGSPGGGQTPNAPAAAFWSQWALERIGIQDPGVRRPQVTGQGSRVAIFDTSPFDLKTEFPQPKTLDAGVLVLDLEVEHPRFIVEARIVESDPFGMEGSPLGDARSADGAAAVMVPDVSDHGLYVAGLVHAVAPSSQMKLIRVLDDSGCGDLATLIAAMRNYALEAADEAGRLDRVIINLSLGVVRPRQNNPLAEPLPDEVVSLRRLIDDLTRRGALVVAAAGNDSVHPVLGLGPQYPAAQSNVVGVAGSNQQDGVSCFSNQGNLAAPAGEAVPTEIIDPDTGVSEGWICQAMTTECADLVEPQAAAACKWGLISLSLSSETRFSYWVGTSFSTPLVSGLAAAALEASPGISPASLQEALYCPALAGGSGSPSASSPLGARVIDVPETLTSCLP